MTDIEESIIKKIRKLLTLANCKGATEAEAKQAMEMAQHLMTKYKISIANVESEKVSFEIRHEVFHKRKSQSINPADEYIMPILQRFYRVRVLYSGGRYGKELIIIGAHEDIEIAKYVHAFLRNVFFKCWNEYKRINLYANRRSYYRGLSEGLHERMLNSELCEKQTAEQDTCQKFELVLRNTNIAIRDYVSDTFGGAKQAKQRKSSIDSSSYSAGKIRGGTISINKAIH